MAVTQDNTKKLAQLAKDLGGKVKGDDVAVGPADRVNNVSFDGESAFWLASEAPLYTIKRNRPKPVPIGTEGEDAGWYQVSIPAEHLKRAIELSLSPPSDTFSTIQFPYEAILRDYLADDPARLERGMAIYDGPEGRGVELRVGTRFIDILALDRQKNFVELFTYSVDVRIARHSRRLHAPSHAFVAALLVLPGVRISVGHFVTLGLVIEYADTQ